MASSVTEIFNQALSIAGVARRVSSPDDLGSEAEECRYWYPTIRDKVLRAAPWPSARKVERLAALASPGIEGREFALPSDCLRPRYLTSFAMFRLSTSGDTRHTLITADSAPELVYTFRQENTGMWEPDLSLAISHALAAYIVSPLNGDSDRINFAIQAANNAIEEARLAQANEDMMEYDSVPPWISVRGYRGDTSPSRFVFPHGGLITFPGGRVK